MRSAIVYCSLRLASLFRVFSASLARFCVLNDPGYSDNQIAPDVILGNTVLEGNNTVGTGSILRGNINIGFGSTLGCQCVLHGGTIRIGKYTQLGPRVAVYSIHHPTTYVSTYMNRRLLKGKLRAFVKRETVEIGNDVWIGHGAILLSELKVGDGAIIGAGALVVKNVPPYAIVGGNPARILRYRFSEDLIEILLKARWWDFLPQELEDHAELFETDAQEKPEAFKKLLLNLVKLGSETRNSNHAN